MTRKPQKLVRRARSLIEPRMGIFLVSLDHLLYVATPDGDYYDVEMRIEPYRDVYKYPAFVPFSSNPSNLQISKIFTQSINRSLKAFPYQDAFHPDRFHPDRCHWICYGHAGGQRQ
jgi:hypothetical protein